METKRTNSTIKRITRVVLMTALILLVPFVAMQFTDEVTWDLTDFVVVGALLIGAGLIYELVAKRMGTTHRVVLGIVLAAALLLIWIDLAVGIFGTPLSGN